MTLFLFLIPVLAVFSALLIFRYNGRKEFLRLDLVQSVYAFLIAPLVFVWVKSFLFFLLKQELHLSLSINELFFVDTALSVLLLFLYAFVVIHSLTKTFELKYKKDPLYDLFEHSEFFHLNFSHLVIFAGSMLLFTIISAINVIIPFDFHLSQISFYLYTLIGFFAGIIGFMGIWNYKSEANFMRLMKLLFAFFFFIHIGFYFYLDPNFSGDHIFYWFTFAMFFMAVLLSFFAEKKEKKRGLLQKLPFQINPTKPRYYFKFLKLKLLKLIRK